MSKKQDARPVLLMLNMVFPRTDLDIHRALVSSGTDTESHFGTQCNKFYV
jgi:hypothetical protein